MPIKSYEGYTAVAYIDVAGFKRLMKNRKRAMETLEHFYAVGYDTLRKHRNQNGMSVEGLFVTDCGILFIRHKKKSPNVIMETLLRAVEQLNRELFVQEIETTTSAAFGFFRYSPLKEYDGIGKNYVFGEAFVNAFLDSNSAPKPDPGICRILLEDFPAPDLVAVKGNQIWDRCRKCEKYLHFFWMCTSPAQIEMVERQYQWANESRYATIHNILRRFSDNWK